MAEKVVVVATSEVLGLSGFFFTEHRDFGYTQKTIESKHEEKEIKTKEETLLRRLIFGAGSGSEIAGMVVAMEWKGFPTTTSRRLEEAPSVVLLSLKPRRRAFALSKMVRISVLNGALKSMYNVEKKRKRIHREIRALSLGLQDYFPPRHFGYIVSTTSAGIMDQEEARRKNVGGKILVEEEILALNPGRISNLCS
ncbi:hypothetical protein ACH5RR_013360 [Cinchona calisaya]|uniref:Uncharacterized protein n=1 Tax=Cinchona calisaya TaxID=153742 RepID=A0ABD3A5J3_9GENT